MSYKIENLAGYLKLRVYSHYHPNERIPRTAYKLYTHEIIQRNGKYWGIIITDKDKPSIKHGFHVHHSDIEKRDLIKFNKDVKVAKEPQLIVDSKKTVNGNVWYDSDLDFFKMSSDGWTEFRTIGKNETRDIRELLKIVNIRQVQQISIHNICCNILTPLDSITLEPGTLISIMSRCFHITETICTPVDIQGKKSV